MYTASDIRNVEFSRNMGGFKIAEVEVFIDRCAETVETLTAEKEELNKKLAILADKLQEYRRDEDNIRSALLSAQRLGDSMVREANQKAEQIVADAEQQATQIVGDAKNSIGKYESELSRLKTEIADFRTRVLSLYKEHLSVIKSIPDVGEPAPSQPVEPTAVPVSETPVTPLRPVPQPAPQAAPTAPEQEETRSKFANLKFGDDYDIGQDED